MRLQHLADALGYTKSRFSMVERGRRLPPWDSFQAWLRALNATRGEAKEAERRWALCGRFYQFDALPPDSAKGRAQREVLCLLFRLWNTLTVSKLKAIKAAIEKAT